MNPSIRYEPLFSSADWPLTKLEKNKEEFIEEVIAASIQKILSTKGEPHLLRKVIENAVAKEKLRIKNNPWRVDPSDDSQFWEDIHQKVINISPEEATEHENELHVLLHSMVERFVKEMYSGMDVKRWRFAEFVLISLGAQMLTPLTWSSFFPFRKKTIDSFKIQGSIEHLRKLAQIGTIVLVPSHLSNTDPTILGWMVRDLGLPPVLFGAGLNLYNSRVFTFFFGRLGTYKIDRRRKNRVYLESLKTFYALTLQKGCPSLFFPGGGRIRNGEVEKKLKLGLLGTTVDSQKFMYQQYGSNATKLFVVPVSLTYDCVVEARKFIHRYLANEGVLPKERGKLRTGIWKLLGLVYRLFVKKSDAVLTIGQPLDVLGNPVDEHGVSIDEQGNKINLQEVLLEEEASDKVPHVKKLEKAILKSYKKSNTVLASQIVAFTAFEWVKSSFFDRTLQGLFEIPEKDLVINIDTYRSWVGKLFDALKDLHQAKKICIESALLAEDNIDDIIQQGIKDLGSFHSIRMLSWNRNGDVVIKDLPTLYYYHNKLTGYELEKSFL